MIYLIGTCTPNNDHLLEHDNDIPQFEDVILYDAN
jgi:hypothetical protein